ncbi:hypothetical protein [Nonomuraea sp. B19D2]|uniref:hypothetical protein n=1 Tax=Nonomuraea sp. B19D2 TaxID=3159561 RepID=UPI0032DBEED5
MKAQLVVDVICVHSYLGYTRFARAADRIRAEGIEVAVEFLPFELAPGASTEGQPLLAVLEQTSGVPVFLIEDLPPLTGSQSETTLLAALRQAAAMKGEHP